MSSDKQIRKMCRDIEEYHLDMRSFQRVIAEQEDIIRQLKVGNELLRNQQQSNVWKE